MSTSSTLIPNIDYYINSNGDLVFTQKYLLDRGNCCQSGCLHCPYGYIQKTDPSIPAELNDAWGDKNYGEEE